MNGALNNGAGITYILSLCVLYADTEVPTCPNDTVKQTNLSSDMATVYFSMRFADNVDNPPHANCYPMSGSSFNIGETTVVCTVVDSSNNSVDCNFTVTVIGK